MRDLLRLKRWMFLALLFSVSSFAQTPHARVGVDRSKTSSRNLPSKPSPEKGCASTRAGGIPYFTPSEAKSKPGTVVFDTPRRTLFIAPHSGGTKELIADLLGVLTFAGLIIYLVVDRRSIGEEKRKLTLLSDSLNRSIDALGKSEQKFHLLAENVPGVIYLCRGRDRLAMQYLNSAVEHLTGYPKADFLKGEISFDALCHVSDVSKVRAEIDSAIIERRPFRLVYRLKRRSGEWRWIEESGVGIFQGESLVYLEGFLSDVTERKQAEEALSASEASYRMLFERNLAGVYRCTLEGHVIDCNEAFARMCGFANCEEVAEHKDWRFFLAGADRQAALTRLKKRGRLTNFETQLQRKDGAPIWVLENASLLKNQNGGAEFIEGTVFDISDRKRAEQMAEQFKRQNELILNSAGEGIYGMDLQGHTTFANPAAARMLGRRVSELMERSHHSLLHSSSRGSIGHDSNGCAICLTLRDGTMRHGDDGTFSRKDGTSFPAEYICTAIRDEAGNVMGAVVTFRDTTERKQLEEQLHRAQKMEAIGSLAGGVAHDFNNLLTGILGFSDIALQQLASSDDLS